MGKLTWLRLFPLLQHLGLVGATGPHPGSKREHRSPLLHAGEQARRQAHTVQLVRSRCGRGRAPTLPQTPSDPQLSRISSMRRYRKPPPRVPERTGLVAEVSLKWGGGVQLVCAISRRFSRAERQCCRGRQEHPRRPYHVQGACHGVAEGSGAKGFGSGSRTCSPEQLQAAYCRHS